MTGSFGYESGGAGTLTVTNSGDRDSRVVWRAPDLTLPLITGRTHGFFDIQVDPGFKFSIPQIISAQVEEAYARGESIKVVMFAAQGYVCFGYGQEADH